jgi:protein-tyrosine phosphatase
MIADRIADNVASNRRTLIYCHYGRSRSITFILSYLIKYHRLSLSTAYKFVQEQRQLALPNIGFWTQLRLYELYQYEKNFRWN